MRLRFFLNSSLFLILLASACAPSASTEAPVAQNASPSPVAAQPTVVDPTATQPPVIEDQPVATSRGDALEATDPSTVSLASGGLHFVEFFRFT